MRHKFIVTALLGLLATAGLASAAEQAILGSMILVKNPGTADKRKLVGKAKEKASPNTLVGDPTVGGATLSVDVTGASPSSQTFNLPQGTSPSTGKPYWSGDSIKGFKYKDPKFENGTAIKAAAIKKAPSGVFSIKVIGSSKVNPLIVLPPNPGTDGCIKLSLGGGDGYNVKFNFGDGTITNKGPAEYKHKKPLTEGLCVGCANGIQDGAETDVDCGGGVCPACGPGGGCISNSDCTSLVCSAGVCQAPSCVDGVQNGTETDVDCGGGSCPGCGLNQDCAVNSDCASGACVGGVCKCPNQAYTFTVNSNSGGVFDSAEWPGGTTSQSLATGCSVTINRPNDNIDLVCSLAAPFSINSFSGYSNCFGNGGEDGDGCQPGACPPAGVGSCCDGRPSCSAALNGSATSQYFVQCLQ